MNEWSAEGVQCVTMILWIWVIGLGGLIIYNTLDFYFFLPLRRERWEQQERLKEERDE